MDASRLYKKPALAVDRGRAEDLVRDLLSAGVLDPSRRIDSGVQVTIPILWSEQVSEIAARFGARILEDPPLAPREARATPREAVLGRLSLPDELLALVPEGWERLGEVVVVRLPEALRPHGRAVGQAFAEALGARCVVDDRAGVAGELREMRNEILFGDDPVATTVENGIKYRLDASRIMFSSGNLAERIRASQVDAAGETVIDMFAGIGYFTLPMAKFSGAKRVIAAEKNPVSFRYLAENVKLNKVEHVVEPWHGDNRDLPFEGTADRVLMGYFPDCAKFLPKALALLKPEGGRIHYHDTAHAERWKEEMTRAFLAAARACGRVVAFEDAHVVKSHSPGVVHAVLVARVRSA